MKNLYFVVLCCLLGFTTSCSDDDNATALLQIDPSTDLVFEAVGGTRTIEVKTDQATWQVESNQAWCKVAQSDGTHFTVTAEENNGFGTEAPGSGDGDGRDGTGRIESRSEGYRNPSCDRNDF